MPVRSVGSTLPDFYSARLRFDRGVRVRIRPLDDWVEALDSGRGTIVKVDVEGTEDEVLGSGKTFLATFRPDVLCEVLPDQADVEALDLALRPLGYGLYRVESDGVRPFERIEPDAEFRDWLFTPRTPDRLTDIGIPVLAERKQRATQGN